MARQAVTVRYSTIAPALGARANFEHVRSSTICNDSRALTFEFTRGRKRAQPAVGRRVQRRVRLRAIAKSVSVLH